MSPSPGRSHVSGLRSPSPGRSHVSGLGSPSLAPASSACASRSGKKRKWLLRPTQGICYTTHESHDGLQTTRELRQGGAEPVRKGRLLHYLKMKRTIVYIDAFNLYYGLLKGTAYKWLDLMSFAKALLAPDHDILRVKYFTSQIKSRPEDPDASLRQMIYLNAVSTLPKVSVIKGFYKRRIVDLPLADEPCRTCRSRAPVVLTEEKRSDVNLAVEMVKDAAMGAADSYVVVSGDSDLAAAVQYVRYMARKQVLVFNPQHGVCVELKRFASYYRNISSDIPAKCQLPLEVQDGERIIQCPQRWREVGTRESGKRTICVARTPVVDQIRLELALMSVYMGIPVSDSVLIETLTTRALLANRRLTQIGIAAAERIARKYGIMNRLASISLSSSSSPLTKQ